MTATLSSSQENIANTTTSIKIHKSFIKNKFAQIPNWLAFKIAQRLPAAQHHAWCLLIYFLSIKPGGEMHPKVLSERTGHSERSIATYMKYLSEVGHVRIIKNRDEDARFVSTTYEVYLQKFFWKSSNTDLQVGENIIENDENQKTCCSNCLKTLNGKKIDKNTDLQVGENKAILDSSNNKNTPARGSITNTRNNTVSKETKNSGSDNLSDPRKNPNHPAPPGADLVCSLLTVQQRLNIDKVLVNSIGKYVPDDEIPTLIENAYQAENPMHYFWKTIGRKKASLTTPKSDNTSQLIQRKTLADKDIIIDHAGSVLSEKEIEQAKKDMESISQIELTYNDFNEYYSKFLESLSDGERRFFSNRKPEKIIRSVKFKGFVSAIKGEMMGGYV